MNNTIEWGSTRITFSQDEFHYIYSMVEKPTTWDLVVAFDTVWGWDKLGDSMRAHPDVLLRWIDKIICAIRVHGRSEKTVFDAIWGNLNNGNYTHVHEFVKTTP